MPRYRFCDLILDSDTALPAVAATADLVPDCVIHPARGPFSFGGVDWFDERRGPDGRIWLAVARLPTGYLLHFPDLADFVVEPEGREIQPYLAGLAPEGLPYFLLEDVLPLVLSRKEHLTLHACAAAGPDGAIALFGRSGEGKSTLTASLARAGCGVLADDCLRLRAAAGQLWVYPSHPGVRLCRDSAVAVMPEDAPPPSLWKRRIGSGEGGLRFGSDPVPLRRFFQLAPLPPASNHPPFSITPLTQLEAYQVLLGSCYRLDIADNARLRSEFRHLTEAVALAPGFRLAYRRDFALLPAITNAIRAEVTPPIAHQD